MSLMGKIRFRTRRAARTLLCALLVLGSPWLGANAADEQDARRIAVGLNVFPTFLAADQDIAAKRAGEGPLLLLVVHRDEPGLAERSADGLRDKGTIRGIPLKVEAVALSRLAHYADADVAGVFVVQRLGEDLPQLLAFGRRHKLLTFSPFEGDVEKGIAAGIVVGDRVLPYVNLAAAAAAGIRIKPFFLRIAERYEQP
ncbi:YfiR/HmsC family protein [Aromatoleum anaerobium]|uniref:DUF4154 domain-containing protein n=2 Tax=Aromatoleum TaxID=551759 RepID=A0ABX1PL89_9RHOO|nr:YfiR/HmsC family protein [Aromatoleum anaerobium]MCK0506628.1 YfiR family protein [Aromatoleum anaerobium]